MPNADPSIIQDELRLQILHSLKLLDSAPDPAFERLTRLASDILQTPVVLVSLVDRDRQFFPCQIGLPEPYASTRETPLTHSFCQHVVATNEPLIIEDSRLHPLVHDNPAITDLNVIAYLGIPLTISENIGLGSFCAIDSQPRVWTEREIRIMNDLAESVMTEIELRSQLLESKRLSKTLRDNERFIRAIVDTFPSIVLLHDRSKDQIVFANEELARLIPDSEGTLPIACEQLRSLVHPDTRICDYVTDQEDPTTLNREMRIRALDGTWRLFAVGTRSFRPKEDGDSDLVLAILTDITQIRENERRLFELSLEHEQTRLMREYTQKLSHDLRTPLSVIQTKLDLITRHPDAEKLPKRTAEMQNNIDQLRAILEDFNAMLSMDMQDKSQVCEVNLNDTIRRFYDSSRQMYAQRQISFELELPQEPIYIRSNEGQILMALQALVQNAHIFTPGGGQVRLSLRKEQNDACIHVADSGIGISESDQKRIFDPFFKVDASRSYNGSGSGMGLTLVKRIATLHQGEILVHSRPESGSTFELRLPAISLE